MRALFLLPSLWLTLCSAAQSAVDSPILQGLAEELGGTYPGLPAALIKQRLGVAVESAATEEGLPLQGMERLPPSGEAWLLSCCLLAALRPGLRA